MRLLIADKLHPRAIEELRTLPLEVVYEPELTRESLETKLQGVGILVVRSTEVTSAAIESTKQLNLIVRAGAMCCASRQPSCRCFPRADARMFVPRGMVR